MVTFLQINIFFLNCNVVFWPFIGRLLGLFLIVFEEQFIRKII